MDDVSSQDGAVKTLKKSIEEGNVFVFVRDEFYSFHISFFMDLPEQVKRL